MTRRGHAALVALLCASCPAPLSVECLPCDDTSQCASQGLTCVAGVCQKSTVCVQGTLPPPGATPPTSRVFQDAFDHPLSQSLDSGWQRMVMPGQTMGEDLVITGTGYLAVEDRDFTRGARGTYLERTLDLTGTVAVRVSAYTENTSTTGAPIPLVLTSAQVPVNGVLASLQLFRSTADAGLIEPTLSCGSGSSAAAPCGGTEAVRHARFAAFEVVLEGLGRADGACVLRVNGHERCRLPRDWSQVRLDALRLGSNTATEIWGGNSVLDNVAVTARGPAPDHLAFARPAVIRAGACVRVRLELKDSTGALAPAVRATALRLDGVGLGGFYEGDCAGAALTEVPLNAGDLYRELTFRATAESGHTVLVSDPDADLLPLSEQWTISP